MNASEILKQAWEAVQSAELPESMQETAFREAVAILTGQGGSGTAGGPTPKSNQGSGTGRAGPGSKAAGPRPSTPKRQTPAAIPDEASFFRELAHESGVSDADLRDVISLSATGEVHVTPPTRELGANRAEQARTVTAIVAVARGIGLGESPVDATAVRSEVQRKRCFDSSNYSSKVIGRLRGVNYGGTRAEIVLTSRWVDEFAAGITQARGQSGDGE